MVASLLTRLRSAMHPVPPPSVVPPFVPRTKPKNTIDGCVFFCAPGRKLLNRDPSSTQPIPKMMPDQIKAIFEARELEQMRRAERKRQSEQGFTLIELMIVMIVIGLLAAIAVPMYVQSIRNAREAVLKEDLRTMRAAIDSYTVDKQKAPQALDDLVQAGYLKAMPVDPFTHRSDTWNPSQDDAMMSLDQTESGITDVHSGAQGTAGDGSSYSSW